MKTVPSKIGLFILLVLTGCNKYASSQDETPGHQSEAFKAYWHSGKAEISSYNLVQSRYGEPREGKAVLIFVTEDFHRKDHVKVDDPDVSANKKVNVMKMNFTRNFITGIYPYSMMLSVFVPLNRIEFPSALKASMSVQEWCGQVYAQLNARGNHYTVTSHSYFEQEADQVFSLRKTLLEDELWSIIRLDPGNLPTGEIDVIPGLFFSRLNHRALAVEKALASVTELDSLNRYTLRYPEKKRTLEIDFEKVFPYRIVRWTEQWMEHDEARQTTGELDKTLHTDYWTKNKNQYEYLRDSLNLK